MRYLILDKDSKVPKDCNTIFVKGLPYSMNEDSFGELFTNCGKIDNVRIVYNHISK